jgi:shikimate kinase
MAASQHPSPRALTPARQRPHVVLVGLMGSGKSTIGRLVAGRLDIPFRDNDAALKDETGFTAADLATSQGLPELHNAERQTLLRLLAVSEPSVIAAAASTVESAACREALRARAFVAWLRADINVLADRAAAGSHRPLDDDVVSQLAEQMVTREPLYRTVADLAVNVGERDAEASATRIVDSVARQPTGW